MNSYGIKNCLRLTIGNVKENILLINQMKKFLKMFKNILIIGCGLIGSSILRASINKKISKNFFVLKNQKKILEKSKK